MDLSGLDLASIISAAFTIGVPGGIVGLYVMLRRERREDRGDAATAVQQWMQISRESAVEAAAARKVADEARAAAARAEAAVIATRRQYRRVRQVLQRDLHPVVEWFDAGAQPPPPAGFPSPELRALLYDPDHGDD